MQFLVQGRFIFRTEKIRSMKRPVTDQHLLAPNVAVQKESDD
jgi:hypothetical protein